jgi:hypothetical protein
LAIFKQTASGEWYLFGRNFRYPETIVRAGNNGYVGNINLGGAATVSCPKEWIGKRVRIKAEVVDNEEKETED